MFATPKEVVAFRTQDGRVPFEEWLDDLNDKKLWRGFSPGWLACGRAIRAIANQSAKA